MNIDILDKFSQHLRNVLARAVDRAFELHIKEISPVMLLWSLSEETNSVAAKVLLKYKLTAEEIQSFVAPKNPAGSNELFWPEFTPATRKLLEKAAVLALNKKHPFIGTEHALEGLLEVDDPEVGRLFKHTKVNQQQLRQQVQNMLRNTSRFAEVTAPFKTVTADEATADSPTPALDHFGVVMNNPKVAHTYTHAIGRDLEIDRLIHVLARRTKNNPLLLGEPGVGKTAIVEGLAKRMASGQVPRFLKGRRLLALDMGLLVAGSMYRGEFEGRLKQVIEEIKTHPEVIVFIDEIHTIVGAGGVGGNSLDAANLLKPALARGDLRCIGATTFSEYQKQFESDPALSRRFQPITVKEPSEEEALSMLRGLRKSYEGFHGVRVTDEALQEAVRLSSRYISDRALPDKAVDVLDEACAQVRLSVAPHPLAEQLDAVTQDLKVVRAEKVAAVKNEKFKEAVRLKEVEQKLQADVKRLAKEIGHLEPSASVSAAVVANVVARITGVPVEAMATNERAQLVDLEPRLSKAVVGQAEVVQAVAASIKRSRVGLQSPDRPLGSFLFLGPSGVGKTELARQLARLVFGSDAALVKIDMSEFNESFTVSKLIGAPAGYVGFKEGAKLTDQVRRRPYSVVLFDEIEKAHPDVFNILLQVLDEGRLTDGGGRQINFRNTVIILTSNIGLEQFNKTAAIGFSSTETRGAQTQEFALVAKAIKAELKDTFRPEFLNRLDQVLVFKPLDLPALEKIVSLRFAELAGRVAEQGIKLKLSAAGRKWLAKAAAEPEQGARLVAQLLQQEVEQPLADVLLAGTEHPRVVTVDVKEKKIVLK